MKHYFFPYNRPKTEIKYLGRTKINKNGYVKQYFNDIKNDEYYSVTSIHGEPIFPIEKSVRKIKFKSLKYKKLIKYYQEN